jgi:hypothetical protein
MWGATAVDLPRCIDHGRASRAHSPISVMSMVFLFFLRTEQLAVIDTIYLRATEGRVVPINPILAMFGRYPNVMPQHHTLRSSPSSSIYLQILITSWPSPSRTAMPTPPVRPLQVPAQLLRVASPLPCPSPSAALASTAPTPKIQQYQSPSQHQ